MKKTVIMLFIVIICPIFILADVVPTVEPSIVQEEAVSVIIHH